MLTFASQIFEPKLLGSLGILSIPKANLRLRLAQKIIDVEMDTLVHCIGNGMFMSPICRRTRRRMFAANSNFGNVYSFFLFLSLFLFGWSGSSIGQLLWHAFARFMISAPENRFGAHLLPDILHELIIGSLQIDQKIFLFWKKKNSMTEKKTMWNLTEKPWSTERRRAQFPRKLR